MLGVLRGRTIGADGPPNCWGVFRWLHKYLLLQQDLRPVYLLKAAKSPLHFSSESKASWLIYRPAHAAPSEVTLQDTPSCARDQDGLRAESHSAGTAVGD